MRKVAEVVPFLYGQEIDKRHLNIFTFKDNNTIFILATLTFP